MLPSESVFSSASKSSKYESIQSPGIANDAATQAQIDKTRKLAGQARKGIRIRLTNDPTQMQHRNPPPDNQFGERYVQWLRGCIDESDLYTANQMAWKDRPRRVIRRPSSLPRWL